MNNEHMQKNKFGTFAGVFTPSILTILGVIMFLRTGYVVGEAGILNAGWILLIAETITVLTAVSMSAIATNTQVKGGGAYFLISRSLGPQYGAAIGIALYLAQALSVPFYIVGFTESLVQTFPVLKGYFLIIGTVTVIILFAINYFGAKWAIKTQFLVMTILALSITSFLGGALVLFDKDVLLINMAAAYSKPDISYWVIFAIYFPAVTGILAGVNMSGDLKDPARSLVRGTFAAVAVGFVIYLLQIVLCGSAFSRDILVAQPYRVLVQNALFGTGFLVVAGVFSATLSSAIGSLMGAPRILQALSRDRIIPGLGVFARGTQHGDEPREAMWLTLLISLVVIMVLSGDNVADAFNLVASIVTMFFLCTYGMINLAAFVESFSDNPSFRPRFRLYHWALSLLGAIECLAVMILINVTTAVISAVLIAGIYTLISRRVYVSAFGDARKGFLYSLLYKIMRRLRGVTLDAKNWRPVFLVLCGTPSKRWSLIQMAEWMEAGRGMVTTATILEGNIDELAPRRVAAIANIRKVLDEHGLDSYVEVVITESYDEGVRLLCQAHAIGPMKPNTVVLGWPEEVSRAGVYARHIRDIRTLGMSVVCVHEKNMPKMDNPGRRIDIWWLGRENGSLMLILAHLLSQNWEWADAHIRILRKVDNEAGRAPAFEALRTLTHAGRIDAEVVIIVSEDTFEGIVTRHSEDADVIFLGFQPPEDENAESYYERSDRLLKALPTTILVSSSGDADLLV